MTKLRLFFMLMALACSIAVLDSCRGKRRGRKKTKTTWRQKFDKATQTLSQSSTPIVPLTKKDYSAIVSAAKSYTGTPYLSGGTTRTGMDCSGLVSTSYQAVNRTLPRISYQQAEAGVTIRVDEVAPGDLVFFTDRKGNTKITHVGIVTEVRNKETVKFIHASTSLGVVENNLMQNYWKNVFLKAVRIQ